MSVTFDLKKLFGRKKALVVGDLMLDIYTHGDAGRISPEAPVIVLRVEKERSLPGGAGNAILNMVSLGMEVSVLGRVGPDSGGEAFLQILADEGVSTEGIFREQGFLTPLKKRFIAENQQLIRVDYEEAKELSRDLEEHAYKLLPKLLENCDVIAVSDYGKGFLTRTLLSHLIQLAVERDIPVVVDPKGTDFSKYRGATLIKPNLSEAAAASRMDKKAPLDLIGKTLLDELAIQNLLITRSKEGISLFDREKGRRDFPAHVREIKDVTGAGDTVLAVIAQIIANRASLDDGAVLSNIAAGIAIERLGCARITLADISDRLLEMN